MTQTQQSQSWTRRVGGLGENKRGRKEYRARIPTEGGNGQQLQFLGTGARPNLSDHEGHNRMLTPGQQVLRRLEVEVTRQ